MNQSNSSKQVLLSVIGVAILVVAVVGVSFAFFNYTRTGANNTVKTGTIFFDTTYSGVTVNDMFPVAKTSAITEATSDIASQVAVTQVKVAGYTTYANGIDYTITAGTVNFNASYEIPAATQGGTPTTVTTALPISINVSSSGLGNETSSAAGAANATFANNANAVQTFDYEATTSGTGANTTVTMTPLTTGAVLARGHIAANQDLRDHTGDATPGSDNRGTIYIRAYLDGAKIAISDTLASGVSDNQTPTATPGRIEVDGYTNGTSDTWVAGRTVFTTEQWNSLNATGASFSIRVEANEGAGA